MSQEDVKLRAGNFGRCLGRFNGIHTDASRSARIT